MKYGYFSDHKTLISGKITCLSQGFFIIFRLFLFCNFPRIKEHSELCFATMLSPYIFSVLSAYLQAEYFRKNKSKFHKNSLTQACHLFFKRHFSKIRLSEIYKVAIKKKCPYFHTFSNSRLGKNSNVVMKKVHIAH